MVFFMTYYPWILMRCTLIWNFQCNWFWGRKANNPKPGIVCKGQYMTMIFMTFIFKYFRMAPYITDALFAMSLFVGVLNRLLFISDKCIMSVRDFAPANARTIAINHHLLLLFYGNYWDLLDDKHDNHCSVLVVVPWHTLCSKQTTQPWSHPLSCWICSCKYENIVAFSFLNNSSKTLTRFPCTINLLITDGLAFQVARYQ